MELDKDRLAKLLNLTESDHDGEALTAIRKANELLRLCNSTWEAMLGIVPADGEAAPPEAPPPSDRPIYSPEPPPPGYQSARAYRDSFRREPLLPRLVGFPFWIVVEALALVSPDRLLDKAGPWLTAVFTLSMILGILAWIGLGYSLLIGLT